MVLPNRSLVAEMSLPMRIFLLSQANKDIPVWSFLYPSFFPLAFLSAGSPATEGLSGYPRLTFPNWSSWLFKTPVSAEIDASVLNLAKLPF